MTDPIRWGILSTGWNATRFVEDLRLLPDAQVVAVGSRTQAAADKFAQRHGIPRAYGSWEALADDDGVDVVYVVNPQAGHHAATKLCLAAGKPVLCEKPFTLDLATARDLVDTARAAGLFLMEAMWTRCNPTIRRMVELIGDGAIGEVTSVHADFSFGPVGPEHRLLDHAQGGGALLDLGVYPITLAHLALGQPDLIQAWTSLTDTGVDQNTAMIFGYASGATAVLSCGLIGETGTVARITGRNGRIELPPPFFRPEHLTLRRTGAVPEVLQAGAGPEVFEAPLAGHGFVPEAEEVHRCLREGLLESPLVPHATTLEIMSIMDDIRTQIGLAF